MGPLIVHQDTFNITVPNMGHLRKEDGLYHWQIGVAVLDTQELKTKNCYYKILDTLAGKKDFSKHLIRYLYGKGSGMVFSKDLADEYYAYTALHGWTTGVLADILNKIDAELTENSRGINVLE